MSDGDDHSRLRLLWDTLVFQLKLAVDGMRDVILIPISLVAAVAGFFFGGRQPDRYLQEVLSWGRKSEVWINLFGHRDQGETSDTLIEPLQRRLFDEVEKNPSLKRALDQVNAALNEQPEQGKEPAPRD